MPFLLPNGEQTFLDDDGNPLADGTVDFYIPSTTTRKDTWQNVGGTILNTNPVELDSAGRAVIWGTGSYRQVVKDADGNTIWDKITTSYDTSVEFGSFTQMFHGDGSTVAFTLSENLGTEASGIIVGLKTPASVASLGGFEIMAPDVDYTLNGVTLTFAVAPMLGQATLPPYANIDNILVIGPNSAVADAVAAARDAADEAEASALAAQAANVGYKYTFATSVVMGDPGTGLIRFNNANPALVTAIAISALTGDSGNPDISPFIVTWDNPNQSPRSNIGIRTSADATLFQQFGVNGVITDNGTWLQIPVAQTVGAATNFAAGNVLYLGDQLNGANGTGVVDSVTAGDSSITIAGTGADPTVAVATNGVSFAKMQQITTDRLLGRDTAATGNVEEVSLDSTLEFTGAGALRRAALTGDIAAAAGSNTTTLATVNANVGSFTAANITVNAKGLITAASSGSAGLTLGTPQATTSGSLITFTGIPSTANLIIVSFNGVSMTAGSVTIEIQIGDAGGLENSGYIGSRADMPSGAAVATVLSTAFTIISDTAAASTYCGQVVLARENSTTFTWSAQGSIGRSASGTVSTVAGIKALSAALDRVGILSTGTFDAGEVNIAYI